MLDRMTASELKNQLLNFTGTEQYFRIAKRVILTQGSKYLADQGACYWLFDLIVSHIVQINFDREDFVSIKLCRNGRGAVVKFDDGDGNFLSDQAIEYTDFPLNEVTLYACRSNQLWVILLPSEY